MKIKLDEHLPIRLVRVLTQLGHEVDTVAEEGLVGQDDARIWEAAQRTQRFLITDEKPTRGQNRSHRIGDRRISRRVYTG